MLADNQIAGTSCAYMHESFFHIFRGGLDAKIQNQPGYFRSCSSSEHLVCFHEEKVSYFLGSVLASNPPWKIWKKLSCL